MRNCLAPSVLLLCLAELDVPFQSLVTLDSSKIKTGVCAIGRAWRTGLARCLRVKPVLAPQTRVNGSPPPQPQAAPPSLYAIHGGFVLLCHWPSDEEDRIPWSPTVVPVATSTPVQPGTAAWKLDPESAIPAKFPSDPAVGEGLEILSGQRFPSAFTRRKITFSKRRKFY